MLNTLTLRQLKNELEQSQREGYTLLPEAASAERWATIRDSERYSAFWENLEQEAERLTSHPPGSPPFSDFILFGETGDRKTYESKRNQFTAGLRTFGILAMTDGWLEWRTGLENAIWSVCNEYTWVLPAHVGLYHNAYPNGIWDQPTPPRETVDLISAMLGFTLAEIIHLTGNRLHPWVVARAREEIDRRLFQVYFQDPVPQNWELKTNNWPAVCASSIGAAAIYLVEDSERLAGMLWRVIGVLRQYLSGFDEQGATAEGPAYWQFGFSHFVYFAELLKERTGGRITLLAEQKIERIAQFPQFCLLTGGKVLNFSDSSDEVRFNTGLMQRLCDYYPSLRLPPEEYLIRDLPVQWLEAARLMLWSFDQTAAEAGPASDEEPAVLERIFTGNQWLISKVQQPDGRVAVFAAKGGFNEEPHNHNDLGHFILHVDGATIFADVGAGVYTKQYFQPEYRYESIQAGSHGHSVPIVDGCRQGFGRQYRAELLRHDTSGDEARFELDLTQAYDCPSLQSLTREFVWHRPSQANSQLTLTDRAQFRSMPSSFQEVFICGASPRQTGDGRLAIGSVEMVYDEQEWQMDVEKQSSRTHDGVENTFYRLVLTRTKLSESIECRFRLEIADQAG